MPVHLSTVEDVFDITGRGLIVVPGVPGDGDWGVRIGDGLTLERPDGSKLEAEVKGMDIFRPAGRRCVPILLGAGLSKDDVPIGTKLWLRGERQFPH